MLTPFSGQRWLLELFVLLHILTLWCIRQGKTPCKKKRTMEDTDIILKTKQKMPTNKWLADLYASFACLVFLKLLLPAIHNSNICCIFRLLYISSSTGSALHQLFCDLSITYEWTYTLKTALSFFCSINIMQMQSKFMADYICPHEGK